MVQCDFCKDLFKRSFGAINRNLKLREHIYCSKSHSSKSKIGEENGMYNKKHSRAAREKMCGPRPSMRGRKMPKRTEEHSRRISEAKRYAPNLKIRGSQHWNWKGGVKLKNDIERNSSKYKDFRQSIFCRDDFTCRACNRRGGKLEVDHVMSFAKFIKLRYNPNNCRTLCKSCHRKYGANPAHNKWATSSINGSIFFSKHEQC